MSEKQEISLSAFWSSYEAIRRIIDKMTLGLNILGTALIVMLVILINSDIIGRTVFKDAISGVPEMVSLSIVAIVFLQIAQTVVVGRLTRSDALISIAARKWPRFHRILEACFNLLSAGLLVILFSASLPLFEKSWKKQTFIGSIGDFTAPVWPVKFLILVGCVALIFQFLLAAIRVFKPEGGQETSVKK